MVNINFESIYSKYSQHDLASALFIISTWINNRSADLKIKYAYTCFLSKKEFSLKDKITNYLEFITFCNELFSILPHFPSLEDFLPQGDWGDIKYHLKNHNYRITYGSELSWSYDFLTNFEIFCSSIETELQSATNENPIDQLKDMLQLSDFVISSLSHNHITSNADDVFPGHIEVPSQPYWEECQKIFTAFNGLNLSEKFLRRFTAIAGELSTENHNLENFVDAYYAGTLISFMLIQTRRGIIPVSPRWFVSALLNSWGNTFNSIRSKLTIQKPSLSIRVGLELGKFIRKRVEFDRVNLLVSATNRNEKPDDFIFPFTILSKNSLYLFCFLSPPLDKSSIKQNLEDIHEGIKSAKIRFKKENEIILALNLHGHFIGYEKRKQPLVSKFVVVVPRLSTDMFHFEIPQELDAEVIPMEQLIGIVEELANADELDDFFEFINNDKQKANPFVGLLDQFGAFKDSDSVLIGGAISPPMLILDSHWGTDFRYKTLYDFWSIFPKVNLLGHPHGWTALRHTPTSVRLVARSFHGSALYFEVGHTSIYVTLPFNCMDSQLTKITNAVAECLENYLSKLNPILKDHKFFKFCNLIQVLVFPKKLIKSDDANSRLKHLKAKAEPFAIDCRMLKVGAWEFQYVFDDTEIVSILSGNKDRSGEIRLIQTLLDEIECQHPDATISNKIFNNLNELRKRKPQYIFTEQPKKASFPELVDHSNPERKHFKLAKKIVAIEAKNSGLTKGKYDLKESKEKIDILLKKIVAKINESVSQFDLKLSLPILLEKIDALVHKNEIDSFPHTTAMKRDIDYDLGKAMRKQNEEFTILHRNYRYLIEKFVKLSPVGNKNLDDEEFKKIVAIIDWFFAFVEAGDQIHHGIFPTGIEIDNEYRVDVVFPENKLDNTKKFGEYLMNRRVGLFVTETDKIQSPTPVNIYFDTVDNIFQKHLEFGFRDLITVLDILARWGYTTNEGEKTSYNATREQIAEVCINIVSEIDHKSILKILDFLTLKPKNLCKVIGKKEYPEIPIWEYYKRHSRYTIRPLIEINNLLYWGPYSAMKSSFIWSSTIREGILPVDLEKPAIKECLLQEKSLVEKELERKAVEIVRRYTTRCEGNVSLHKRDKLRKYPPELGDFDVLAYFENYNTILSIECKYLQQVFSLKDARDLKEELFGKEELEGSYIGKIVNRHHYLEENWEMVLSTMKWKIDDKPKVISLFCSRVSVRPKTSF